MWSGARTFCGGTCGVGVSQSLVRGFGVTQRFAHSAGASPAGAKSLDARHHAA
jgi:hypothetical protein